MAYLIAQVWGPLLVAALCGAVAGWFWHSARMRPRQQALEAERRRLRAELLDLAVGARPPGEIDTSGADENARRRIAELERALAEARGRGAEADVLRHRLGELERDNGQVRPVAAVDVTDYTKRIAALESEIEAARRKVAEAEALQARVAELTGATPASSTQTAPLTTPQTAPSADVNLMTWRARYFEARTGYLEHAANAVGAELDAAKAQIAALAARALAPSDDAEKTQLIWRNRYLAERLKYVETTSAAGGADTIGVDQESADRRRWRTRYLEQRVAYLETGSAAPAEVEPLKARIAELEQTSQEREAQAAKLIEAEDEVIRSVWKARYLQSRVKFLEDKLTEMLAVHADAARAARTRDDEHAASLTAAEQTAAARLAAEVAAVKARHDAALAQAVADARAAPAPAASAFPAASAPLAQKPAAPAEAPAVFRLERPAALSAARNGAPDDLTLIAGLTAQNENALRALGVHHFDQIAAWTGAHAAWVNHYLHLGGRIVSERWVEQARALVAGGGLTRRYPVEERT